MTARADSRTLPTAVGQTPNGTALGRDYRDTLGVALAGASRTVVGKLRALAERSYREGDATVFAGKSRMTAPAAALINGVAAPLGSIDLGIWPAIKSANIGAPPR